ncbi:MAG TPA: alpha/beta hydrolase [Burkholderiaceae bacterium]|nr:alpha/beta hydrolase [Burkholderiaceae bacterium]
MSERTVLITNCGKQSISYLENGAGVPLVLLHGVGSNARSWEGQLDGLSDRFRVIAWDAPGYGRSMPVEPAAPTASDYSARLKQFADTLGLAQFHLIGHSLGAIMAARFAVEFRARVISLTLASPSSGHARLPQEEQRRLRDARLNDLREMGPRAMAESRGPRLVSSQASDAVRARVIDNMSKVRPEGYTQAVWLLTSSDTAADVARLPGDLPVQFIIGGQDRVTPPQSTRAVAAARPAATLHELPECGHALYLEQPGAFNELVTRFARGDLNAAA